ncbi:MAG: beta-ketoacyl-ACP synthase 3, partial [Gammaproteobacteria bacterium]|nr:beta-ketoacyl-ACP synthase 3 [Gammaproteobacteria bacterium]
MSHAAITGWGKCLPPAVLSNDDLSTMLETSDAWIVSRTGIRERRISHVGLGELAYVAAARALAAAGLAGNAIELIVFGSCSYDDQVPNMASGVQLRIGAHAAAALDINTACTSFLYGLSTATAMIRTGVVRNALVIGAELISPFMDWSDRDVAVLFGDGAAAVVLQATDAKEGLLAEKLGCFAEARETLRVQGMGGRYANRGVLYGVTRWQFEGQEIFKRAVHGMAAASESALARLGLTAEAVDLVVPHQANLRIIEAVAKKAHVPMERVYVNVQRYGNMSAATIPVALCEALEEGRVR